MTGRVPARSTAQPTAGATSPATAKVESDPLMAARLQPRSASSSVTKTPKAYWVTPTVSTNPQKSTPPIAHP